MVPFDVFEDIVDPVTTTRLTNLAQISFTLAENWLNAGESILTHGCFVPETFWILKLSIISRTGFSVHDFVRATRHMSKVFKVFFILEFHIITEKYLRTQNEKEDIFLKNISGPKNLCMKHIFDHQFSNQPAKKVGKRWDQDKYSSKMNFCSCQW